jgi:2-dehydropantoate 2-reductase
MKLLIVGAGAIGQWIGANVQRAGAEVVFVGREKFAQAASRDGLHVQLPDGSAWHLPHVRARASVAQAAGDAPFDAIALCVKAYAVEDALREIMAAGVLAPHTLALCFQNGIGAEETVARFVGDARVIAGTLTSAVSLVEATTVKLERAKGGVGLAALSPLPSGEAERPSGRPGVGKIAEAFSMAPLLNARQFDDANAMKWSKLLLNLVGNATSAIFRRRVADLLADDFTAKIEMQQLREAEAVMRAAGMHAVDLPGAPAKWFARAIRMLPDALLRWVLQRFFAQARGDKWPSFYYDAVNQTGRSEVQWLNGVVSAWGRRLHVPTPVNDELTRLVVDAVNGRDQTPRF